MPAKIPVTAKVMGKLAIRYAATAVFAKPLIALPLPDVEFEGDLRYNNVTTVYTGTLNCTTEGYGFLSLTVNINTRVRRTGDPVAWTAILNIASHNAKLRGEMKITPVGKTIPVFGGGSDHDGPWFTLDAFGTSASNSAKWVQDNLISYFGTLAYSNASFTAIGNAAYLMEAHDTSPDYYNVHFNYAGIAADYGNSTYPSQTAGYMHQPFVGDVAGPALPDSVGGWPVTLLGPGINGDNRVQGLCPWPRTVTFMIQTTADWDDITPRDWSFESINSNNTIQGSFYSLDYSPVGFLPATSYIGMAVINYGNRPGYISPQITYSYEAVPLEYDANGVVAFSGVKTANKVSQRYSGGNWTGFSGPATATITNALGDVPIDAVYRRVTGTNNVYWQDDVPGGITSFDMTTGIGTVEPWDLEFSVNPLQIVDGRVQGNMQTGTFPALSVNLWLSSPMYNNQNGWNEDFSYAYTESDIYDYYNPSVILAHAQCRITAMPITSDDYSMTVPTVATTATASHRTPIDWDTEMELEAELYCGQYQTGTYAWTHTTQADLHITFHPGIY